MNLIDRLRRIETESFNEDYFNQAYEVWLDAKFGLIRCLELAAADLSQYRSLGMAKPSTTKPGYLKLAIESDPDMQDINVVESDDFITFYW